MDSPVRVAVIGAGLIGHRHVKHILEEPRCRLAGVIDPDPQAKSMAENAGVAYYRDIAPFLNESDAEGVIIATPNNTHTPIGIQCATAGLHLLVEKPIDSDPADRLRREILSRGGTRPGMELYVNVRGREPSIQALLDARGLTGGN